MKALTAFILAGILCAACVSGANKEDKKYNEQKESELNPRVQFKRDNYTSFHVKFGIEASSESMDEVLEYLSNVTGRTIENLDNPFDTIFFPKVDEFSLMRLDSTRGLLGLNTTVRAWVEIGGNRSESRIMLTGNHVIGSRSIVISLDSGNITAIDWDDTCSGCGKSSCLDNACAMDAETLDPSCNDPKELEMDPYRCGVKIYLVWVGTDVDGKPMKSISKKKSKRKQKYILLLVY